MASGGRRVALAALGLVLAVSALALAWNGELGLRARHALLVQLGRPNATSLTVEGVGRVRLFLNPADRVITPQILQYRSWEPIETRWFVRSLRPGDHVVDIGANIGYYTLLAGLLVGDTGRVFAFEPDPESFALLQRNVRLNGLHNVVLEQKAVSDEPGSIQLFIARENKGDHRIYETRVEERPSIEVEAVALDPYFEKHPGRIDFVKIDTQGAEMVILEGMRGVIEANPKILMAVEYWPDGLEEFGVDPLRLLDFLASRDFRFFDLNRSPLVEVGTAGLLEQYDAVRGNFTNLLAMRGRVHVLGLRRELARWMRVAARDPARRQQAQREVDALEAQLSALSPEHPGFPRGSAD